VSAELQETEQQEDPMDYDADTPDRQPAGEVLPATPVPVRPPVPTTASASERAAQPTSSSDADVPQTGDASIDAVVAELAQARERPLDEHVTAGEKAHRVLQGRLSDLGGE
jgi:hypothetical protein